MFIIINIIIIIIYSEGQAVTNQNTISVSVTNTYHMKNSIQSTKQVKLKNIKVQKCVGLLRNIRICNKLHL